MQSSGEEQAVIFDWEQFENSLKHFDWYYEMSDDHRVWVRGRDAKAIIDNRYKQALSIDPIKAETLWATYNPFYRGRKVI